MRRRDFALLLPAVALAQPSSDPILKAMQEEMTRSRPLSVVGGQPIYFMECALDDAQAFRASASLGALFSASPSSFRVPRVAIRIGDKKFDNTNYIFSELFMGTRFDPDQFPLDNNSAAMRQIFWLAIDRAYKTAIEAIGRKKAALRNITQAEEVPDFSDAPAVKMVEPIPAWSVDEGEWKNRITRLSKVFTSFPDIYTSSVDFESSRDIYYYANSEGTELRYTELISYVRARANGQAADGMRLRNHAFFFLNGKSQLSTEAAMEAELRRTAEELTALLKAPVGETYSGPVLFEAEAAAQLFSDLIGSQAAVTRKPVAEPGRPINLPTGDLDGRLNSRILPSSFTVVDDPTQSTYKGRTLMGHYPVDLEGAKPQPIVLVEKGSFKNYLSTRIPTRDSKSTNGHARLPGSFGGYVAYSSNLFVKSEETIPAADMKKKLLEIVQQRNKPYGLLVRKLDYPSTASFEELRGALSGASSRPAPLPLLVYRVYPDGREELVRGLRFRSLNVRALKDITLAGNDEAHFDYLANGAPFAVVGGGNYVFGCTTVAPSILFDDLELERPQVELPKLPVVPPPPLTA
ncbi:MAG: metallopeptidase TldD-related protein [Acidobacteria bacterium]|nr:metallopeptidase TldD-related protein [Acidobacteriota bacterium]